MNLITTFQELIASVPDIVQPLITAAAGAVPFIEGEGSAAIGIVGGINPVVAVISAVLGSFLCVAALVFASSGARNVVVTQHRKRVHAKESSLVTAEAATQEGASISEAVPAKAAKDAQSPRAVKFQRALSRYGVPGVSLLGPLLLPTQFTATMLAAAGVSKARILFWQAIAITGWTIAVAVVMYRVVSSLA